MRSRTPVAVLLLAAALWAPAPLVAQRNLEYEVKGEFLYNFLTFIEWPPAAFPQPDAPLRVCMLGADPFGGSFDAIVRGEKVGAHPIAVERLKDDRAAGTCHVLFVSHLDDARLAAVVRATAHQPVLIVGESRRVLELCGAIALVVDGERVRFDINIPALLDRNLKASSKLLRVAREASDRFAPDCH